MNKDEFYEELENITQPRFAYLLGFLWGDGYIRKLKGKTGYSCSIHLQIQKEDAIDIMKIFKDLDFIKIHERFRKNRKPTVSYSIYSKKIYEWFLKYGYESKSFISADAILEKIPKYLKYYWFRGLIDADGTISIRKQSSNKKYMKVYVNIYSGINQDWKYISDICKELGIKFKIVKRIRKINKKIHQSSQIDISKRNDVLIFCNFIYKNVEKDCIGLKRKFLKYKEIKKYNTIFN